MPIYEYRCGPCDHTFETLVRSATDVPRCPKCGGIDLAKQLSIPAAAQVGARPGSALPVCEGGPSPCGPSGCRTGMCQFD
ncbi:MAG: zinc ribbon domain-containing protein [Isosphaeraceae bacterium]|nr:zinc ribbon domain-containing protein [Isosphaeraceae bacterium]